MEDEDDVDVTGEFKNDDIFAEASIYDGMSLNLAELLPELGPSSWLLSNQSWNLESDIEVRSKPQNESPVKLENSTEKAFDGPCESNKIQKHRKLWSSSEKELFIDGFKRYGNKWSKIAKLLGTRTTLQVKSFARQYLKQTGLSGQCVERLSTLEDSWNHFDSCAVPDEKSELISTENIAEVASTSINVVKTEVTAEEIVRLQIRNDASDSEEDVDIEGFAEDKNTPDSENKCDIPDTHEVILNEPDELLIEKSSQDAADVVELERLPEDVLDSSRTFRFEVPEKELHLERDIITSNEKLVQREFFEGRPQKTPERYLKIRNYILDTWEKCKPNYLNKTSVRPGLKNCGDVNCIGRIHNYLEQIGAINFGCEQTIYNQTIIVDGSKKVSTTAANKKTPILALSKQLERSETMRPRKRKVPDLIVGSENHGYTIEHGDNGEIIDVASVVKYQKRRKAHSNPYHLLPCIEFSPAQPAPYNVVVDVRAVMIMDLHAHMSTLEVIGLLGGRYDFDNSTLCVLQAEPCRSISTGLECEMDPVSQTVASDKLQQSGCSIVGWYHSHPTFAPNPSVRDIDTQTKFQNWFSKGGTPFLGVIVTPHLITTPFSKFRYLMVDTETMLSGGCHQPFKFSPTYTSDFGESAIEEDMTTVIHKILSSSNEYKLSLSSVKKIINGVHRLLTAVGTDQQSRTTILAKLGKQLVDVVQSDRTKDYTELVVSESKMEAG
ncbi:Myb-like, SWIRM and MPN domains 1 [Chamberlinius hualienensis]